MHNLHNVRYKVLYMDSDEGNKEGSKESGEEGRVVRRVVEGVAVMIQDNDSLTYTNPQAGGVQQLVQPNRSTSPLY